MQTKGDDGGLEIDEIEPAVVDFELWPQWPTIVKCVDQHILHYKTFRSCDNTYIYIYVWYFSCEMSLSHRIKPRQRLLTLCAQINQSRTRNNAIYAYHWYVHINNIEFIVK